MTAYATPTMFDPTAVMGRRILAYLIDALIGIIVFAAIFIPVAKGAATVQHFSANGDARLECERFNREHGLISDTDTTDESGGTSFHYKSGQPMCVPLGNSTYTFTADKLNGLIGQIYLFAGLVSAINLLLIQAITGGSIGKLLVGIRVVRQDGRKAGIGWLVLRWVLLVVDGFCCGIVGLITAFSSKGHRRVGDMAAGTLVVHRSAAGQPVSVPGLTGPPAGGYAPGYPPAAPQWGGQPQPGAPAYGPPSSQVPGSWSPPGGDATSVAPPAAAGGADAPQWDEARNTYIQYDRAQSAWVQWDAATSSWVPISQ